MDFATWEPVYEAILADFGYDREGDEQARDLLQDLLADQETLDPATMDATGETVAIAGAGPSLDDERALAESADLVFAASTAADRILEWGLSVDCMVTDLDKNPETVRRLAAAGVPVAVHAHGDNLAALRAIVPDVETRSVLPTTQAAPAGPVRNLGGFTDGDRAAFLADHLGATELTFPGWDFEDPSVSVEKARKLAWAERLLYWLERRRGDRFDLLDGRRDDIDTGALPVG